MNINSNEHPLAHSLRSQTASLERLLKTFISEDELQNAALLSNKLSELSQALVLHLETEDAVVGDYSRVIIAARDIEEFATDVFLKLSEKKQDISRMKHLSIMIDQYRNEIHRIEAEMTHGPGLNIVADKLEFELRNVDKRLDLLKHRSNELGSIISLQEKERKGFSDELKYIKSELEELNSTSAEFNMRSDVLFSDLENYLNKKKKEVEELVGYVAENSIAGSYEKSASSEKTTADDLRLYAVLFMIAVLGLVGWTFVDLASAAFDLQKSLIKILCSVLFSVPAAYLTRESAKHRQQQYSHLQTALDLKAIGPYIASLPKEKQDELRSDIARKIFTPKDFEHVTKESYPLNSQEIVTTLLDKIPSQNQEKQANKNDRE